MWPASVTSRASHVIAMMIFFSLYTRGVARHVHARMGAKMWAGLSTTHTDCSIVGCRGPVCT